MRPSLLAKALTGSVIIACVSILSGCWWGRRDPHYDEHRDEHHDEHHDDHHEEHR